MKYYSCKLGTYLIWAKMGFKTAGDLVLVLLVPTFVGVLLLQTIWSVDVCLVSDILLASLGLDQSILVR